MTYCGFPPRGLESLARGGLLNSSLTFNVTSLMRHNESQYVTAVDKPINKGAVAYRVSSFPKKSLSLLYCVPLYVCRLCVNFQDLCARLLGMAALRILLLTFISRFVIDFLSIRKVIIFSGIATDDRHPLRSRSIHQNAANCMMIRFRYIAQPRGTENLLRTLT